MSAAPAVGSIGELQFSVRRNGRGNYTTEWRPGYEVTAVVVAEDRSYRLNVRKDGRVLEGVAPECFRLSEVKG